MKLFIFLSIFALAATTALAQTTVQPAAGQQPFPTVIPSQISLCYANASINGRHFRMPQSIDNLVALIRKVEAHPDTALWTPGKMAVTLLHRFRYDGIVDVRTASSTVVPIIAEKVESDKYRMQWRLLPGMASDFPESSLTMEEKCALHWMLSYTVNHTQRAEERPGSRMMAGSWEDNDDHADGDSQHHDGDGEIEQPMEENEPDYADSDADKNPDEEEKAMEEDDMNTNMEDGNEEEHQEQHTSGEHQNSAEMEEKATDEEEVHEHHSGDEDYGNDESYKEEEDYGFSRRKRQSEIPRSANPLEGGVVYTRHGTVAMGPVLAGIAAGMSPQSVQLKDFIRDPNNEITTGSLERMIDNTWATTLAGDIAQTALLRVPGEMDVIGPRGQWNSTFCPREYKLEKREHSMLTYAELYGGIDGLLMSKRVKTWDSTSYLKLSAILEMYYSDNGIYQDQRYRACNRLNNYRDPTIVDQAMLKTQSINAALVLFARGIDGAPVISPDVKPVDQISTYVDRTMREISLYLGNNNNIEQDFQQCQGPPAEPLMETPATYTDLTFVIDQLNEHGDVEKQKELIAALANLMDVQVGGSRIEVVSSKDGTPFFTVNATSNRAELACRITGLNVPYGERRIAETLTRTRSRILTERSGEKAHRISGGNTRAVIVFVSQYTTGTAEKDKIAKEKEMMLKQIPDVHLMFATFASPEEFRPFVTNFEHDIIRMNKYAKYSDAAPDIAKRLVTVGARLSFPICEEIAKASPSQAATSEASFTYSGFLNPRTVQYFRIGPEHFYSSSSLILRFKSTYGVAKFCVSNSKTLPGSGDQCTSALAAGETVEFKYTAPCAKLGGGPQNCHPIYVSATPIGIDDNIPCSEKDCHTPDQVKFTFSHEGMRCVGANSAQSRVTLSNVTLTIAALLSLFLYISH